MVQGSAILTVLIQRSVPSLELVDVGKEGPNAIPAPENLWSPWGDISSLLRKVLHVARQSAVNYHTGKRYWGNLGKWESPGGVHKEALFLGKARV